ncbi:HEAT repeat domain-containing protein, partial [Nocardia cyriacigeorgica]|uniref:HEAT repeat domain-containing protein n=1 Tax=Nocardia cyriacigeorgica TaxID=135487 RepID=UPI00245736DF
ASPALGPHPDAPAEPAAARGHSAWPGRGGAARGRAGADPESALPALTEALSDPHLDVRKAAVLALSGWAGLDSARIALKHAVDDPDADVRAYARRALAG